MTVIITARAKAFTGQGTRTHRFMIDGEMIRVWDPIAGYYTTCHSLSRRQESRIRKLAEQKSN